MKLTITLCFVFSFTLSAVSYSQKTELTLNLKNARLEEALNTIREQSEFSFWYKDEEINLNKMVTVQITKGNISNVLMEILKDQDVSFAIIDKHVVLYRNASGNSSIYGKQQQKVTGTVTDATTREPLIGVNITLEGTTIGSVSDVEGKYSIELPSDKTVLVFSFIGYNNERIEVGGRSTIDVTLVPDIKKLEEVVVIGYGQAKKKDLSVAVSSVNMEKMKSRPVSALGMIQGQMAGVTITSNGGDPLSQPSVTIRGQGSRFGDEVLYVVDGVPGAKFNTDDVESITILKDAASAAIYGAHVGSGGVIVVTTKKAQEGKIKVNANIYRGWQQAWKVPEALTAEEYNKVMTDAANNGNGKIPSVTQASIYPYGQTTRTNWTDEIFRLGKTEHYALSLTGGTEKIKTLASVEYDKKEGTLLNTFSNNFGARMNVDFKVNSKLTFTQLGQYNVSNGQGGVNTTAHTGVIAAAMFMPSSAPVYESNSIYSGTVPREYAALGVAGDYGEVQNPVATLNRLDQNRPDQFILSSSSLTYKPWNALTIKSTFSIQNHQSRYEDFVSQVPEIGKTYLQNSRTLSSGNGKKWLWENTVTYNKTLGQYHNLTAMAGFTSGYEDWRYVSLTGYTFASEDESLRLLVNATDFSKSKPEEYYWEESQVSSFGRLSYSFADRYFLTGSLRYDASSKLYKSQRDGIFPAVSGAWKISSESFFRENVPFISLFKLRGSWGQIGNLAGVPRGYTSVLLKSTGSFTYLGNNAQTGIDGLGLATFANLDLTWETSVQTDLGVDIGLFSDKLNLVFDYFNKETKDAIDLVPVASVAGISESPYGNVGDIINKGYEFGLNYNNRFGNFNISVGANYSYLENEVSSLGQQDYIAHTDYQIRSLTPLRSKVGQSWYSYYLFQTDGLFQSEQDVTNYTFNGTPIQPDAKPGDIKYKDLSGPNGVPDGTINEYDRTYMGSYAPKHTYGFNINAEYKGFDLGIQFQGIAGVKVFNAFKVLTMEGTQGWNMSKDILDSWTYDKSSGIPRVTNQDKNLNYTRASDYFLDDGSYLRLKNITLGYTIPQSVLNKGRLKGTSIRVYASGENVLTFTKYGGMDPEVGNYGLDGGKYPVARVFNIGVNVGF